MRLCSFTAISQMLPDKTQNVTAVPSAWLLLVLLSSDPGEPHPVPRPLWRGIWATMSCVAVRSISTG